MAKTRLIIISQSVAPAFVDWLESFADEHGPIELWTGIDLVKGSENVIVRPLPAYDRSSYITRLITWIQFSLLVTLLLVLRPPRIPVLGTTNPPSTPFVLWLNRVVFKRSYGIIEYDIYPQIMSTMGLINTHSVIYRLWYLWHKQALKQSNLVITLSELMADELQMMAGGMLKQLVVIPTWTDTDRIKPMPRNLNPFAQAHNLSADLVVLYSGNLGVTHSIETIIEVAEKLKDEANIQLVVIGHGAKYTLVETAVASNRAPNIKLLPLQPTEILPYSFASADVAFVTIAQGYERLSLPSKTYDMMAAGCAIVGISETDSGLDRLLAKHSCGRNFSAKQPEMIAAWILELANNKHLLQEQQINARQAAVNHYSAAYCGTMLTNKVREMLLL